jgi:hypothetical protein
MTKKVDPALKERALRMDAERQGDYSSVAADFSDGTDGVERSS